MSSIIDIYQDLLEMPDFLGVVCKYIAQSECGFQYNFGSRVMPVGTKLYRIRKCDSNTDFSQEQQWQPAPHKPQNRCNAKGETALYLGSKEAVCLLETHIKYNEKYILGKYVVTKDIDLGGFIYISESESRWKHLAGMLLNTFLIAPSRNEQNKAIFDVIDSVYHENNYDDIRLNDLYSKDKFKLPYRIGAINKSDKYYEITNKLCSILKGQHSQEIRYSSCYIPVETIGINCSEYNVVLYDKGIDSVQFVNHEIKINKSKATAEAITEILLKEHENYGS